MTVYGNDVPEPLAVQLTLGDGLTVVAIVARKVLAQGVGEHLIHIDSNSLHSCMLSLWRWRGNLEGLARIIVEHAPTALAVEHRAFAHLVPKLGPQSHLASEAALSSGSCESRFARGRGNAVVLREQRFAHPLPD